MEDTAVCHWRRSSTISNHAHDCHAESMFAGPKTLGYHSAWNMRFDTLQPKVRLCVWKRRRSLRLLTRNLSSNFHHSPTFEAISTTPNRRLLHSRRRCGRWCGRHYQNGIARCSPGSIRALRYIRDLGSVRWFYCIHAASLIVNRTETWFIVIFGTIPTVKPVFKALGKGINHMCGRPTNRSASLPRLERIYIPSDPVTLATLEPCSLASTSKSRTVISEDKASKSRTVISEDKVVWTEKPRQRQFKPWSMDFDLETNREAYRSRYGPVV